MECKRMNPKDIKAPSRLASVLKRDSDVLSRIRASIRKKGFDPDRPLTLARGPWSEEETLIDGFARLEIAIEEGVEDVPVRVLDFERQDDALAFMFHGRGCRHTLTDGKYSRRWSY
jgi:ParB-like chromosome segregation protein Spo0J